MASDPPAGPAIGSLVADLQAVFGSRLHGVATYMPAGGAFDEGGADSDHVHTFALVERLEDTDLRACAALAKAWSQQHLAVPLLMTRRELATSLDAFPLEVSAMIRQHTTIFGEDPFAGLSVQADDIRRAAEVQVRSHLLHLREAYVELRAEPRALGRVVTASARPFAALLAHLAELLPVAGAPADPASRVCRWAGLDAGVVQAVLLAANGINAADAEALYFRYIEAVTRLAQAVDQWHD